MRAALPTMLLPALLLCAGSARADAPDAPDAPVPVNQMYLDAVHLMTDGRTAEAAAAFEHLIQIEPQHAGGWLDLAVNQCALGQAAEAERLFREIELRFTPSAAIVDIINGYRKRGCTQLPSWQPKIYRNLTLSRGTDSNINQGASNPLFTTGSGASQVENLLSDSYLPHRDNYAQLALDASAQLEQRGTLGFAQLRARHNDRYSEQDTNALLLGVERPFSVAGWRPRAMGLVSLVSLGGQLYQRQVQLQTRGVLPLPLPDNVDLTLSAALGHTAYLTRQKFDANSGELSALLNARGQTQQAQAGFGLLVDRGEAGRLGGNRHGWYANAQLQHQFGARWNGEIGVTLQHWQGQTKYSPGLIDAVREQDTRQVRVALSAALTARQSVQLEWRRVQNRENISLFQYNSQAVQLNWRWNGF